MRAINLPVPHASLRTAYRPTTNLVALSSADCKRVLGSVALSPYPAPVPLSPPTYNLFFIGCRSSISFFDSITMWDI